MKRSTLISVSRSVLQLATLFLAAAPIAFSGESCVPKQEPELIGQMVVTAAPQRPFLGHMVITASRVSAADALVADLGAMTVTAQRVTTLASTASPNSPAL